MVNSQWPARSAMRSVAGGQLKQSGMVLILALLIIAAILATAIIFSNLIIREIQQSRLIDQSIQAYYLAESGAERALYQTRRREAVQGDDCNVIVVGSSCQESNGYCSLTNNEVSCITGTEDNLATRNGWLVTVANEPETTVNLKVGESFQLDLFSPYQGGDFITNIEAFRVSSNLSSPMLYGEITNLTWLLGGSANCPLDNPAISKGEISLSGGTSSYITGFPGDPEINPNCSYVLRLGNILLPQAQAGQFTITIHSSATGDPRVNRFDIPSRLIIDSQADFGRSRQKVRVKTPIRPPLSGLYDFVIFSEEEIVK